MSDIALSKPLSGIALRISHSPLLAALLAMAFFYGIAALRGFPSAHVIAPDNDSQMRLVEVRDLLAGQGWFDLHQYRMGTDGGFVMHWSRFIDAPIALIILVFGALAGQATGETIALIVWPALLFMAAVYLLVRATLRYAGPEAMFPAFVIATLSLYMIGVFGPGDIDHHNAQIVCTLGMLCFMLEATTRPKLAYLSGACAGMMLAIGMETAASVAFGGLAISTWYLVKGPSAARAARNFGIGLFGMSLAALILTKPIGQWGVVECDAFSGAQFAAASIAGLGLALVTSLPTLRRTLLGRALSLAALGGVVGLAAAIWFPQCISTPYANLPPLMLDYLIGSIDEAQPITKVLKTSPEGAFFYYGTMIAGLAWLVARVVRRGATADDMMLVAFLLPAVLVSLYQVRGMNFATPVAVIPLTAMVVNARRAAAEKGTVGANLRMIGAWLVSINVAWLAVGLFYGAVATRLANASETASSTVPTGCYEQKDYAQLKAMPTGRIAGLTNLGASILMYTSHHALGGPYHRDVDGNMANLTLLMATPDAAEKTVRENRVDYVVMCPGDPETTRLRREAPQGLDTQLADGKVPSWLQPVQSSMGEKLQIYRVLPD